jgi:hypothetical protein
MGILTGLLVGASILLVWWAWVAYSTRSTDGDAQKESQQLTAFAPPIPTAPPVKRYRFLENIKQSAIFEATPTGPTGMQWDMTWRFPQADNGAFVFTAEFGQGLMVGLGRHMTDTTGGYIIHIRAPANDNPGEYLYGISPMQNMWDIRAFASEELGKCPPFEEQTFWVRYAPRGIFTLGRGSQIGERVIFHTDYPYRTNLHNLPVTGLKFVGFGTSAPGCQGYRRITGMNIVADCLPPPS